jgi:hypothetical protein
MSESFRSGGSSIFSSARLTLTNPDSGLKRSTQNQALRKTLQEKYVDLSTLQSSWSAQQVQLSNKCEDLISQLRDSQAQLSADRAGSRAKHIQKMDAAVKQHQLIVLDLQAQIQDAFQLGEDDDEGDVLDLENEIESVKSEMEALEKLPPPNYGETVLQENLDEQLEAMEQRIQELQKLLAESTKKREEESKESTQKLQELVLANQEIHEKNQAQLQQLIDELNGLDKTHAGELIQARKSNRDTKKQQLRNLKSITGKTTALQQQLTQVQREQRGDLESSLEAVAELKRQLQTLTNRQNEHLAESTAIARRLNDEKRKFSILHKELEMLKSELSHETVDRETLLLELDKIDNFVLSQFGTERFVL